MPLTSALLDVFNGFNRYIVECKLFGCVGSYRIIIRFNRYIVECK